MIDDVVGDRVVGDRVAGDQVPAADRLDDELADVCGQLNVAHARLVSLVAEVLADDSWRGAGIRSAAQWVAWRTGLSPARAREVVRLAERRDELPTTIDAFERGQLAVDQVAPIAEHVPPWAEQQVAELAVSTTVSQLRRVVRSYPWEPEPIADPDHRPDVPPRDRGTCSISFGHDGRFHLSARGPEDHGHVIERALTEARDSLFDDGNTDVGWWDALVEVCQRSLDGVDDRTRRDRYRIHLHVDADRRGDASFADGRGVPPALRDLLVCDGDATPTLWSDGRPVSVGRARRIVPDRTRRLVEHRDRGCRAPGCSTERWVELHHIVHWRDGGTTDTSNLLALCGHHHREHHLGRLGISGDADLPVGSPGAVEFVDEHGRAIPPSGRARPPTGPLPDPPSRYVHPLGERLDATWVAFG